MFHPPPRLIKTSLDPSKRSQLWFVVMDALRNVLSPEVYEGLTNPKRGPARGLPPEAFTSDAFLALEYERLFPRHWVFVGHGHDIPGPGDVKPISIAGLPLILVRNHEGEVTVFHNVCRHRGRKVVDAPCKDQRLIVCPYHRWAYNLDGKLQATPHFGGLKIHEVEGFEPAEFGLQPVRCVEWHHWILVNLDGEAPPFDEYVKPMRERIENWPFRAKGYGLDSLQHVGRIDFGTIKGNWKVVVENYIEPYHVPWVHQESCGGQPLDAHYAYTDGNLVGSAVHLNTWKPGAQNDQHTDKREELDSSALYLVLFPNFALGLYGDSVLSILAIPEAPGKTREQFDMYVWGYVEPTPEISAGWMDLNRRINAEDIQQIEAVQEGMGSPVMRDGPVFSPHWESCVQQFEKLVLEALNGKR